MTGKRIGYIRVSTVDQNPERQLSNIALDKKFIDYASGTTTFRPQLLALIDYAREDDLVIIHSMDRLARNVKDLLDLIETFTKKGVTVQFITENLIFNGQDSSLSKLLLTIIGAVAAFEHALIRERQLQGIEIAKKAGKYKGPKKKLDTVKLALLESKMLSRDTKTKIAKELGISRNTLYKYLKEITPKTKEL